MSNSKLAPEGIEPLASLNPYRTYPWYTSNRASSCNVWEFTVGELYGCVCHRPIDELARCADRIECWPMAHSSQSRR